MTKTVSALVVLVALTLSAAALAGPSTSNNGANGGGTGYGGDHGNNNGQGPAHNNANGRYQ